MLLLVELGPLGMLSSFRPGIVWFRKWTFDSPRLV